MPAVPLQMPQPGNARADVTAVTAAAVYVAVHAAAVVAACAPVSLRLSPLTPPHAGCAPAAAATGIARADVTAITAAAV